ncbi:unnamed protein product (macronuclear) [Paramecium tetraurelia]|uniref:Potassium channel domain-containing protein n=1 Tax=Paramecium tetraurelia TaxID=5888 RepID=A0BT32_PARTE|nr:uncharacterized protein GSPATT00031931001 [Paramecium tetraurelia]CAK61699.1 unnamed protein product [Paramecium tetraurelia]|eukprot:XP_001429097.1 hypothetical protein (macronuclear) [Paramecium tetraurelia strain d4-2]
MNSIKNIDLENKLTENSESSPFKSRRTLINRQNTETSLYLKNLHKNLQYIESISANQEQKRGFKIKKRHEYVSKFIKNLRSPQNHYSKLTNYHFSLIDDLATYDSKKNQSLALRTIEKIICFQKFIEITSNLINKLPLFQPDSQYKSIWDVMTIVARLYFLYLIPLDMAWIEQEFIFQLFQPISYIMLILVVSDQILEFNTAYYECGQIVNSRIRIFKNSILRNYSTEWISTFILIIYTFLQFEYRIRIDPSENVVHLSLMLFIIHASRVRQTVKHYEQSLNVNKKLSSMIQLGKFILFLFYFLHIFACFWFWIGSYSLQSGGNSWVSISQVQDLDWNLQYLEAFYFSTVTMFTVGYGDVAPVSNLEKATSVLFIMITSIQLPYSINTVGKFIEEITAYGEETMKKLSIINAYMEKRKISFNLQMEIRQYLNYYWQTQNQQDNEDQKKIINQLSECLKERLMGEAYQSMLNDCPLFKNRFSQSLKQLLVKKVRSVIYPPESFIDNDQIYLCFIDEGEVEIHLEINKQFPVGRQMKGHSLGISSFITGKNAPERFKCLSFTKVMLLSRDDFLKCLHECPQDFEIFCEMRDYLTYNQGKQLYPTNCFSCDSNQHKLIECPLVHFVPDKEQILKKHIKSQLQERQINRQRFTFRQNNCRGNLSELTRAAWRIQSQRFERMKLYYDSEEIKRQMRKSRSVSFYNEKDIVSEYKHRFIHIVKMIIYINRLRILPKTRIKKNPQNNEQCLAQLYDRLKLAKRSEKNFHKEIIEIQDLIDKLHQKQSLHDFEINREYQFYNCGNNLSRIPNLHTKLKIGLIMKFMPYFLFPGEIIKRFGCKPSIRNIINYRRRKNVILI